jgi:hypothetical protein
MEVKTPVTRDPLDILKGGITTWQLPIDPSCAPFARSVLRSAMTALGLPDDVIDDGTLAVSETATNAWRYGPQPGPYDPIIPPELWLWARVTPQPQLVVTVFDANREWEHPACLADSLDEGGRGLGIVANVSDGSGMHWSRSQIGTWRAPGKAFWYALPLPGPWADPEITADPAYAASRLQALLGARGSGDVQVSNEKGVSLVSIPSGLNVWVGPKTFTFNDTDGTHVQRPLLDLQDLTEHLIQRIEEDGYPSPCPVEHPAGSVEGNRRPVG